MTASNWIGGATAVTHVMTGTITQTWANTDVIKTQIWLENGTEQSVSTTVSGFVSIENQVRNTHLTDLQNSVLSEFAKVTWTASGTVAIVATAKLAGRPISGNKPSRTTKENELENDATGVGGNGINTWVNTTANAGPNDGNTAANWGGTAPVNTNTVLILPHPTDLDIAGKPVSYDLLYGLDHSDKNLNSFKVGRSYTASIGDALRGFHFKIDCTTASPSVTVIDTGGPATWIAGAHTAINISGLPIGQDAFNLGGGEGTTTTLRLLGSRVLGKVTIQDACPVVNFECFGANMDVEIGTEVTTKINSFTSNAGNWLIERAIDAGDPINDNDGVTIVTGGIYRHTIGIIEQLDVYGGIFFYNGSGTLTRLNNFAGVTSFEENIQASVTVTNASIWSGRIIDKSGLSNVVYTNDVIVFGGSVTSDTATTQAQN